MEAQHYKIVTVKQGNAWESSFGQFQSYSLALEGMSEPVLLNKKMPVKHEPTVGETIFGVIEEKTNSKGNPYNKFTVQQPPDTRTGSTSPSNSWESPERQESINRSVALNNAVIYAAIDNLPVQDTLNVAEQFVKWLQTKKEADKAAVEEVMGETEPAIEDDLKNIPF